ncbi:MAG: alpha/beta hydrolase-fold protein [Granulicella sp.]
MTLPAKSPSARPAIAAESLRQPENFRRISGGDNPIGRLELYCFHSSALPDPDHRNILVYLPEAYDREPNRRFPVFYLHDGQNLFDPHTSYVADRTWQAHTTADRLTAAREIEPVILVGIANAGSRRIAEYTPTRDPSAGGGEGRSYGNLIVNELKPFLDHTYRTRPAADDTALGGSSLGGLISLYLGLEFPGVFRKLAIMSPSLWWDQSSILGFVHQAQPKPPLRIWLDMGTAEGTRQLHDADHLHQLLLRLGWQDGVDLNYMQAPNAAHDEQAWAARFDHVLRFLFPVR